MIPAQPKIVWSLTLLVLAAPAAALDPDYECVRGFGGRMERISRMSDELRQEQQAKAVSGQAAATKARQQAETGPGRIHETMVAMRDAVGVGEKVADYIERHPNISVEFHAIPGLSSHDEIGGSVPLITLRINKDLPRTPRVLSIPIAKEAFEMMYADMPESSEKAYMHASVVSRAWIELGGSKDELAVIEPLTGYRNEEMTTILRSWFGKPSHAAIRELGAARNLPSLQQLLSDVEMELDRLAPIEAEYEKHMHETHHPDPALDREMKRVWDAKERHQRLEVGLKLYVEFMTGVEYQDAQGARRNDHSGEDAWRQMYQGRY